MNKEELKTLETLVNACTALLKRAEKAEEEVTLISKWEVGFRNIVTAIVGPSIQFEIPAIVQKVKDMKNELDRCHTQLEKVDNVLSPFAYLPTVGCDDTKDRHIRHQQLVSNKMILDARVLIDEIEKG